MTYRVFTLRQRRCWPTIFRFVRWKKLFKVQKNKLKQALFRMNVVSLRFGYVVYNDPNIKNVERGLRGLDAECYYLVPSWVMECAFVENPKRIINLIGNRKIE